MNKIEVKFLNSPIEDVTNKLRIAIAFKLTQRGNKLQSFEDFIKFTDSVDVDEDISKFTKFNHEVPQKMGAYYVVIYGVSRRFLAQITKHHEAYIVSTSLQYTKYDELDFCIPYNILGTELEKPFLNSCKNSFIHYKQYTDLVGHDEAAYLLPEASRCCLIVGAPISVWQHIIRQRICKRNTLETRYVMLKILKMFQENCPEFFPNNKIRPCCEEFNLSCKKPYDDLLIAKDVLEEDFPKLCKERRDAND